MIISSHACQLQPVILAASSLSCGLKALWLFSGACRCHLLQAADLGLVSGGFACQIRALCFIIIIMHAAVTTRSRCLFGCVELWGRAQARDCADCMIVDICNALEASWPGSRPDRILADLFLAGTEHMAPSVALADAYSFCMMPMPPVTVTVMCTCLSCGPVMCASKYELRPCKH